MWILKTSKGPLEHFVTWSNFWKKYLSKTLTFLLFTLPFLMLDFIFTYVTKILLHYLTKTDFRLIKKILNIVENHQWIVFIPPFFSTSFFPKNDFNVYDHLLPNWVSLVCWWCWRKRLKCVQVSSQSNIGYSLTVLTDGRLLLNKVDSTLILKILLSLL
jgi:hypothetical protein